MILGSVDSFGRLIVSKINRKGEGKLLMIIFVVLHFFLFFFYNDIVILFGIWGFDGLSSLYTCIGMLFINCFTSLLMLPTSGRL